MKRVSLTLCAALVAAAVIAAPTRPVQAQGVEYDGTCGKALPSNFIGDAGDWTHSVLKDDGVLGSVSASFAIAPGGAGLATASATTVLYGGSSIATFLMAMEASCLLGDYVGLDTAIATTVTGTADFVSGLFGRADPTVLGIAGIDDWTPSPRTSCSSASGAPGTTVSCAYISPTSEMVEFVQGPASIADVHVIGRYRSNYAEYTEAGVTIPAVSVDPWHTFTREEQYRGSINSGNSSYIYGSHQVSSATETWIRPRYPSITYANQSNAGVGDVSTVPPGEFYYGVDTGASPDAVFGFFHTHSSITAKQLGWRRVHTVDVQCMAPGGGLSWRRVVSPPWWEAQPTERVPVVKCANDAVPVKWIISAPPTGITLPTTGTSSKWTLEIVEAPADWLTATPDWTICLTSGTDCGTPDTQLDVDGTTEICVWGGYQAGTGACGPILSPETTPEIAPRTRGVQTVTTPPDPAEIGAPTTVTTQPEADGGGEEPPPSGTDIVVPINPGTGLGSPTDGDGCIGGWSWFNPIEWVLEPVKCALLWAFVPDSATLSTAFDEFQTELFAQFPFSLIALAVGFLDDVGTSMTSASGSGCFGFGGSWSFGSAGSVAADDVCIGEDVTVSLAQRATLLAIIGGPMVFALLRHAWGMALGGSKREAET